MVDIISDEELRKYPCDQTKPFIFMSYAHKDREIVRQVFVELCKSGLNVWIDALNIMHDDSSWNKYARDALLNPNCYCVLFFRSEASLVSKPCNNEIATAKYRKVGGAPSPLSPISVDIWKKDTTIAEFAKEAKGDRNYSADATNLIDDTISMTNAEANAIRLREEGEGDVKKLSERIINVINDEKKPEAYADYEAQGSIEEDTSTLYDYFIGGYRIESPEYDRDDEEYVRDASGEVIYSFAGYSPTIAIKTLKEGFIVVLHDAVLDVEADLSPRYVSILDDNEEETAVFYAKDADVNKYVEELKNDKKLEKRMADCGYAFHTIKESGINFQLAFVKHQDEKEIISCLDNVEFDESEEIRELIHRISQYQLAEDPDDYVDQYTYWNE